MSLDKAITHNKEHRKQYRKSAAFDVSCRPHGGCPWCLGNRTHKHKRREPAPDGKGIVQYWHNEEGYFADVSGEFEGE